RREGERLAFAAPPLRRRAPSPTVLAKVAAALGLKASQIVTAQCLDNGTGWLALLLADADTVLALTPDHRALRELGHKVGVAGIPVHRTASIARRLALPAGDAPEGSTAAHEADASGPLLIARSNREARAFAGVPAPGAPPPEAEAADLEVRAFAASVGIEEDPVTGSLNASLAQWLIVDGCLPARYLATQGQCLGRDGRIGVERDAAGQVWIGGAVATCVDGHVML
ncbi:MAG: phenazine biosynthesis protein PhzF, partial [Variovorax sp.]|nr:phenazine biosynthesis protein PhzF [Variovorax sp.]